MADPKTEYVLTGLRDAHAMESATVNNLERLIGRTDQYPQLKTQLEVHLQESKQQRDEIETQLKALGSDASAIKDLGMKIPGQLEAMTTAFAGDTVPKDCMNGHGYENFEIASYISLGAAAQEAGLVDVSAMCDRFIVQERAMATYFLENLPEITRHYMRTQKTG